MPDYALEGPKWGSTVLGTGGGVVTWAIDATVSASFLTDITAAFAGWSAVANITFTQVASTASSNIDFAFGAIDGLNNILGEATYYYSGRSFVSTAIEFDSGEGWRITNGHGVSSSGASFYTVALHEIGHVIGLDHYNATPAVMNAYLNPAVTGLTVSDIHGIQAIYGPAMTVAKHPLVDSAFYFGKYADAAASGLDATTHYDAIGWHQGKDPDAFFSTNGYLAAHPEVRSGGLNPVEHYDSQGWRAGFDPSASFDTSLYLERNPDVKAASMDPLAHYLQHGRAEGRAAYTAVGQASSFNNGSFDAEFYLLSNPDVAQVASSISGDSFVFARTHYEEHGWHEGRNPNSVFDVRGYLNAFTDVRNAGIDPLKHYDNYGWKEGRDPSASFDTDRYIANYVDVANAHIDPLLHFLQYGIHEGRSSFADGLLS